MTQPVVLDTCAAIWLSDDQKLSTEAWDLLDAAARDGAPTYVSPITAWEVGMLVARRRLQLLITPQRWFSRLFEASGVRLADMSPDLLIASTALPGAPPTDPADCILAATAREYGATLITRDRALLEYGRQGHISILAC